MQLIHSWLFRATRLCAVTESSRSSLTSPCSCAQIGASYLGGFRRWRWYVLRHVAHELVFVVNLEGLVESALEANRGHRLTAQGSPHKPSPNRLPVTLPDSQAVISISGPFQTTIALPAPRLRPARFFPNRQPSEYA